jgi:hypothetical protein
MNYNCCCLKRRKYLEQAIELEKEPLKFTDEKVTSLVSWFSEIVSLQKQSRTCQGCQFFLKEGLNNLKKHVSDIEKHISEGEILKKEMENEQREGDLTTQKKLNFVSMIQKIEKTNEEDLIKVKWIKTLLEKLSDYELSE